MMVLSAAVETGQTALLIFDVGLIVLAGLVMGRLAEMIKIPDVTGYLVAGLLLGPIAKLITGHTVISESSLHILEFIPQIALGFIAFQVGNELWFGKLKKTGAKIVVITIVQAVLTVVFVILGISLFAEHISIALILGAIAAATAPAPIMMIVKKYRTKGELTDTLLPVVGLDDAVGVIIFGILLSVSVSLLGTDTHGSTGVWALLEHPLKEIGISILIGAAVGFATGFAIKTIDQNREREVKNLNVAVIAVLVTTGLALYYGGSPILTPMIAGTIVTNMINKECYEVEEKTIASFVPPLMIAFFTIAGAELDFGVLLTVGAVGAMYIVGRIIGKVFGSYVGCKACHSSKNVQKYLGLSLLPQSGVAIGLSFAAVASLNAAGYPEYGAIVKNVVLAAVLIFELFGPLLVKLAFKGSNEIRYEV